MKKGKYKRTYFREYIPKEKLKPFETFDFEKVYQIPNGKKLHFAYRSLDGNIDISLELQYFNRLTNEQLLQELYKIKQMPQTRTKGERGSKGRTILSSGKAGNGTIKLKSQQALQEEYNTQRKDNRRADTRLKNEEKKGKNDFDKLLSKTAKRKNIGFQHTEKLHVHWQNIKQLDDDGSLKAYTEITPRKLLVIGNTILWNVTEAERGGLYNEFYTACCEIIPDMKTILP